MMMGGMGGPPGGRMSGGGMGGPPSNMMMGGPGG